MKRLIQRWLGLTGQETPTLVAANQISNSAFRMEAEPKLRVELVEAVNGRVLQIGKYKPNPHGPDWTFTLYVVGEGETLPDAIATCLVLHGG